MQDQFRTVYIPRYGNLRVNSSGTIILGKSNTPLSIHWRNADGYVMCRLSVYEDGKRKRINRLVHRIVAQAFVPNPLGLPEVNHIDGNKENNDASNLEWCTRQQNMAHAVKNKLVGDHKGEKNGRSLIEQDTAERIRELYDKGVTKYRIAKIMGLGWTTVDHIIKRDTWN